MGAYVHLLMFVCAMLVSTSFIVGEYVADKLDPAALTLVRFVIAALILLPVIAVKYGLKVTSASLVRYALISGCLVVFFWCMFLSLRYTTALNTSVLFTLVPAMSCIYSAMIVRERLGRRRLIALACGLVGAIWVIFRGDLYQFLTLSWNHGDVIFFFGCLSMGLYTPLVKLFHRGEAMEVMTFWILVTGTIWLFPLGGYALYRIEWEIVELSTWGWVAYLACFTTVISFYLTQYAIPVIGPTRVMAYSYLYPGLVLVMDMVIGRGWPDINILPGVGIILISMMILQVSRDSSG